MTETIKHASGLIAELVYDQDCESPLESSELMPRLARFESGYINPAPEFERWEDVQYAVNEEGAVAFGVWGSSRGAISSFHVLDDPDIFEHEDHAKEFMGYIVYSRELIPEVGGGSGDREVLLKDARSVVEQYEQWANGDCWGVVVKNPVGERLDSCWGFVGQEYAEERAQEMLEECAEAELARMKTYRASSHTAEGYGEEVEVEAVSMVDALRQLAFEPTRLEVQHA